MPDQVSEAVTDSQTHSFGTLSPNVSGVQLFPAYMRQPASVENTRTHEHSVVSLWKFDAVSEAATGRLYRRITRSMDPQIPVKLVCFDGLFYCRLKECEIQYSVM